MFSFFFFKQKTAYEMRISDWSSDVCSSDLTPIVAHAVTNDRMPFTHQDAVALLQQEPGHVMEGVAERHRLRVLELALDDGRPEPLPGKPLQDEQVVTFRVHLQEVHTVAVCVGQHIGKGWRIYDLICKIGRT